MYNRNMNKESTAQLDKKDINASVINRVKRLYNMGMINRETAKIILEPTIKSINSDADKLSKKLGVKAKHVDFTALMR